MKEGLTDELVKMVGVSIAQSLIQNLADKQFEELSFLPKLSATLDGELLHQWAITRAAWDISAVCSTTFTMPYLSKSQWPVLFSSCAFTLWEKAPGRYLTAGLLEADLLERFQRLSAIRSIAPSPAVMRTLVDNVLVDFILSHVCKLRIPFSEPELEPDAPDEAPAPSDQESGNREELFCMDWILQWEFWDQIRERAQKAGKPDLPDNPIDRLGFVHAMHAYWEANRSLVARIAAKAEMRQIEDQTSKKGATGCLLSLAVLLLCSAMLLLGVVTVVKP
jgi:hypothetical protein